MPLPSEAPPISGEDEVDSAPKVLEDRIGGTQIPAPIPRLDIYQEMFPKEQIDPREERIALLEEQVQALQRCVQMLTEKLEISARTESELRQGLIWVNTNQQNGQAQLLHLVDCLATSSTREDVTFSHEEVANILPDEEEMEVECGARSEEPENAELETLPELQEPIQSTVPEPQEQPATLPAPTPAEAVGEDRPELNFTALTKEFDIFLKLKTQGMPRNKAWIAVVPNYVQRWVNQKKLEHVDLTPDFLKGLLKACYDQVKPSDVELELADRLADPETRVKIARFNDATKGDVTTIHREAMHEWVGVQLLTTPDWLPKWTPEWCKTTIATLLRFPWTRVAGGSAVVSMLVQLVLRKWKSAAYLAILNAILSLPAVIKYIRWLRFRAAFLKGQFKEEGYFKCSGMINAFNPGNASSR